MKEFLKRFCKHNYKEVWHRNKYDKQTNEKYCIRTYRCTKCDKQVLVDSRQDPYKNNKKEMSKISNRIKKSSKRFCRHDYEKVSWCEAYDERAGVRYSIRIYKCTKCDKQIEVDGRRDPYDKTDVIRYYDGVKRVPSTSIN